MATASCALNIVSAAQRMSIHCRSPAADGSSYRDALHHHPRYNHAAPLAAVLRELAQLNLPCLLVDDGSEPVAAALLDQLATEHAGWVTLLRHPHNRGKGGAVKTALLAARARGFSHALQVDADGQHNLSRLSELLAESERFPQALISGAPEYDESVPKGRLYGRYLTHVWVWIETLSFEIKDSMCGLRVYPVEASCALLEQCTLGERMDFDIEIMVRLHWRGVAVRFVPVKVHCPKTASPISTRCTTICASPGCTPV